MIAIASAKATRRRPSASPGTAEAIFIGDLDHIRRRSDRVFAWLMGAQWLFALTIALIYSPYGWEGKLRSTHVHVQSVLFLGTALSAPVILLALKWPGRAVTRQVATIAQMLWSALLIHLTGGRIETHFHVFGSLAFLAFYRDWKVLLTGTVVVAGDHLFRGLWWPESVYGIPNPEWWRFLEHAFWVVFEDVVLVMGLRISLKEMRSLAERQAALRTSEANYRLVAQSASDGIITIDAHDRIIFANPAASQMFGYAEDEILEHPVHAMITDLPRAASEATGEPGVVELRGVHHDGTEIPVEVSFGNLSMDGETKCTAFLRDITERKKVDRLTSELLSTVSHELRTPLTSLRGFVELILHRDYSPVKQRELLTIVHKETIRLTNLINDFLDIQRIESGRQVYSLACVDLRTIANDTTALFASEAAHRIVCRLPADLPSVTADVDRIRQVMSNLLSNAIKFSPGGGEIVIEAMAAPDAVTVSVTDQGIGIPADALASLFTKFFRVDNRETRSVGGSGLGLALVKDIIEAQRGRVWVETALGKGSKFSFSLPRAQETKLSRRTTALPESSDRVDVLIVEDDDAYARLLGEYFRDAECTAVTTAYGEEGLALIREQLPRVILLDVHLRGSLDGWDVLLALQQDAATRRIPVILTTLSERRVRGLALDGGTLIRRPPGRAQWSRALKNVLRDFAGQRVMVVGEDSAFREITARMIERKGFPDVARAATADEALALTTRARPDVALIDLDGPGLNGLELLDRLRAERSSVRMAVFAVSTRDLDAATAAAISRPMAALIHKNSMVAGSLPRVVEEAFRMLPTRAACR